MSFANGPDSSAIVIAVGDFEGGGSVDLLGAGNGVVDVVLGGAPNGPTLQRIGLAEGDGATSIATADFNGDGKLDLALVDIFADRVTVMLNTTH